MKRNKIIIDKSTLEQYYVLEKKTQKEIGEILGCATSTININLKAYGIPVHRAYIDLTNQKFGRYLALRDSGERAGSNILWECQCDCGTINLVRSYALLHGRSLGCKSCNSFKGYGEITLDYFTHCKKGAKKRDMDFCVTIEYVWNKFVEQKRKCALSSLEIHFSRKKNSKYGYKQTASLDRVDSNKGYVEGNIQWVHKDINRMKQHYDEDFFIKMCHLVASTFPRHKPKIIINDPHKSLQESLI